MMNPDKAMNAAQKRGEEQNLDSAEFAFDDALVPAELRAAERHA